MSTSTAQPAAPATADNETHVIGIDYSTLYGRNEVMHRLKALQRNASTAAAAGIASESVSG